MTKIWGLFYTCLCVCVCLSVLGMLDWQRDKLSLLWSLYTIDLIRSILCVMSSSSILKVSWEYSLDGPFMLLEGANEYVSSTCWPPVFQESFELFLDVTQPCQRNLVWLVWLVFYGISTLIGYFLPNPLYTDILDIYD